MPDPELDCSLRKLALEAAVARIGTKRGRSGAVFDALRLAECGPSHPSFTSTTSQRDNDEHESSRGTPQRNGIAPPIEVVVATDGDDSNAGTVDHPLRTAAAARDLVRKVRQSRGVTPEQSPASVHFRAGTYVPARISCKP